MAADDLAAVTVGAALLRGGGGGREGVGEGERPGERPMEVEEAAGIGTLGCDCGNG